MTATNIIKKFIGGASLLLPVAVLEESKNIVEKIPFYSRFIKTQVHTDIIKSATQPPTLKALSALSAGQIFSQYSTFMRKQTNFRFKNLIEFINSYNQAQNTILVVLAGVGAFALPNYLKIIANIYSLGYLSNYTQKMLNFKFGVHFHLWRDINFNSISELYAAGFGILIFGCGSVRLLKHLRSVTKTKSIIVPKMK